MDVLQRGGERSEQVVRQWIEEQAPDQVDVPGRGLGYRLTPPVDAR